MTTIFTGSVQSSQSDPALGDLILHFQINAQSTEFVTHANRCSLLLDRDGDFSHGAVEGSLDVYTNEAVLYTLNAIPGVPNNNAALWEAEPAHTFANTGDIQAVLNTLQSELSGLHTNNLQFFDASNSITNSSGPVRALNFYQEQTLPVNNVPEPSTLNQMGAAFAAAAVLTMVTQRGRSMVKDAVRKTANALSVTHG